MYYQECVLKQYRALREQGQKEFYKLQSFVIWLEDTTEISLKQVSENEIKEYFQIIDYKEASYFNDIIIAIYQFYEYLQTKNIIKRSSF